LVPKPEELANPIVVFMPEISKEKMGGNMRLGLRETKFQDNTSWSKMRQLYGQAEIILERHRHRYEVNPKCVDTLHEKGLTFVGKDLSGQRMEILELQDHPWFVGVQFHPEYLSRVLKPSQPYLGFIAAACGSLDTLLEASRSGKAFQSKFMDHVQG